MRRHYRSATASRPGNVLTRERRERVAAGSAGVSRTASCATPHYLASAAGAAMLADGGNAVDAAFAANFVLGVVTPYMCGFGGDLLAMVWDGRCTRTAASAVHLRARPPTFVREQSRRDRRCRCSARIRSPCPARSRRGSRCIEKFATRSFGELVAARAALRGGRLPAHQARRVVLREQRDPLRPLRALRLPRRVRRCRRAGDWVRQPELARTIRTLADDGPDAYYRGPIGAAIAERMQARGRLHDRRRRRRAHRVRGSIRCARRSATSRSSRCRRRRRA